MRNQIKKMMKKENGFTLVELLAVLAILAIIVAIAIPTVGSIVEKAEKSASDSEIELVEDAARLYFVANSDKKSVDTDTLESEGFLDADEDFENITFNFNDGKVSKAD